MDYDIAVIGGGPGGYVAAIRAAGLGAKVALLEKDAIGGTCLNRGCIPTKTLLASAGRLRELRNCREFGLKAENIGFDFSAVMARKNSVVGQLRAGTANLVKAAGVEFINAQARLLPGKAIAAKFPGGQETISAGRIIVAAGSQAFRPPIEGADLSGATGSDELLDIEDVPESLTVIGGGVVGMEFAGIFQAFGCQVTVVEMLPNILDRMDKDIIARLSLSLRKQGVKFLTGSRVKSIARKNPGLSVTVETPKGEQEILCQRALFSAGRIPAADGLGLEDAGVAFSRQGISVNERLETNVPGIYAAGDVTGRSMLAHAAAAAGAIAAENACGQHNEMDFRDIPSCVFTAPEAAGVGLTEQAARLEGRDTLVSKFNFASNGKAAAAGETDGFVKLLADGRTQAVLGMHIMGPHASDIIMEGALAIKNNLTAKQLAHTIHPHPTFSEAVMECARAILGEPIHQIKIGRK
ncbi:MAG: dihydrolipoyl dehydrogenase [Acidaminococcales bacterium]|jgi:dihydrolipoamide dehydrogenase|nr:dihydrolipoyl dehydrogenase [Acidaminococcales bacterium]